MKSILECFRAISHLQRHWEKNVLLEIPFVKLKENNHRERNGWASQVVFMRTCQELGVSRVQEHRPIYRIALNS
jgi:hypothetical protein